MSYYQGDSYRGDYYRGDYYRGDPGLLSFVAKAARGLVSVAKLTPGGALMSNLASSIPIFRATRPPQGGMRTFVGSLPGGSGPGTLVQDGMPFGPTLPGGGGGGGAVGFPRQRALHWNRATYVTRGGGTSRWPPQLLVHPKGTEAVPSRRMNVGNARALRRALHRVGGFARLARRVMSFVHPRVGRGHFKFHKKKRAA